jgi:hypothetical protein
MGCSASIRVVVEVGSTALCVIANCETKDVPASTASRIAARTAGPHRPAAGTDTTRASRASAFPTDRLTAHVINPHTRNRSRTPCRMSTQIVVPLVWLDVLWEGRVVAMVMT